MNGADILVLAIIALIVAIDLYILHRNSKNGKTSCGCDKGNCSGNCSGCSGCASTPGCSAKK